jgi:hypothetical protein
VWVHDINKKWTEKGEFHHLVKEHEEHPNCVEIYFRMAKEEFNVLHDLIRSDIKTRNTPPSPVFWKCGNQAEIHRMHCIMKFYKNHLGVLVDAVTVFLACPAWLQMSSLTGVALNQSKGICRGTN